MSKTFEIYKKLKEEDNSKIYFFKIGIFYVALDDDAKMLSKKYNFKLTNFTPDVLKCGFPCTSFYKYYTQFKNDNLDFKIVEENQTFESNSYLDNIKVKNLIEKINSYDINNNSVSEAFKFIEDIKKLANEINLKKI